METNKAGKITLLCNVRTLATLESQDQEDFCSKDEKWSRKGLQEFLNVELKQLEYCRTHSI